MNVDPQLQQAAKVSLDAAAEAIQTAAVNAAKPGAQTTEFKALVGTVILTGLLAGLHVLSAVPGPWMLPALALSAAITVGSYALSRGKVKAAALQAASSAVSTMVAVHTGVPSRDPDAFSIAVQEVNKKGSTP